MTNPMHFTPLIITGTSIENYGAIRLTPDPTQRPPTPSSSCFGRIWTHVTTAPTPVNPRANTLEFLEESTSDIAYHELSTIVQHPPKPACIPLPKSFELRKPLDDYTLENLVEVAILAIEERERKEVLAEIKQCRLHELLAISSLLDPIYMQLRELSATGATTDVGGIEVFFDENHCLSLGMTITGQGGLKHLSLDDDKVLVLQPSLQLCRAIFAGYIFSLAPQVQNLYFDTEHIVKGRSYLITTLFERQG